MASGDPVLQIVQAMPPASSFATMDTRAGGSTPAESMPVFDFDASTQEYMDFMVRLSEKYAGGGLTVQVAWMATSATSGDVRWGAAFRRFQDDAEDLDTSQTYDFNYAAVTAASASGEVVYDTITFTDGADMDSLAAGEMAIMRVTRDAANGADTMTGDAELVLVSGKET